MHSKTNFVRGLTDDCDYTGYKVECACGALHDDKSTFAFCPQCEGRICIKCAPQHGRLGYGLCSLPELIRVRNSYDRGPTSVVIDYNKGAFVSIDSEGERQIIPGPGYEYFETGDEYGR